MNNKFNDNEINKSNIKIQYNTSDIIIKENKYNNNNMFPISPTPIIYFNHSISEINMIIINLTNLLSDYPHYPKSNIIKNIINEFTNPKINKKRIVYDLVKEEEEEFIVYINYFRNIFVIIYIKEMKELLF